MNNNCKLSVVVPVYQAESFLDKSVRSLLKQGYENIEIILIDDGSRDRSPAICDGFQLKDKRVRVIHQKNQGPSAARNAGLAVASGDYIAFVDADDAISKDAFYEMMMVLNEEPYDILIFGSVFNYYKKGIFVKSKMNCVKGRMLLNRKELANKFVMLDQASSLTAVWNKVFKADIIRNNKIRFDETMRIYEDFEFFLQACTYVEKACVIPEAYYHYTIDMDQSLILKRTLAESTYIQNMDTLKKTLDHFLTLNPVAVDDRLDLNEIIFRGYLYEIERAFYLRKSYSHKMKIIDEFFTRNSIRECILNSSPTKFRMYVIHRCFIRKHKMLVYLVFLIKTYETRLLYNHSVF